MHQIIGAAIAIRVIFMRDYGFLNHAANPDVSNDSDEDDSPWETAIAIAAASDTAAAAQVQQATLADERL